MYCLYLTHILWFLPISRKLLTYLLWLTLLRSFRHLIVLLYRRIKYSLIIHILVIFVIMCFIYLRLVWLEAFITFINICPASDIDVLSQRPYWPMASGWFWSCILHTYTILSWISVTPWNEAKSAIFLWDI